jgi:hypothetical protein
MTKGNEQLCKRLNKKINYPKFCIEEYYNDGRVGGLFCEFYDFLDKKCLYKEEPEKKEEKCLCPNCGSELSDDADEPEDMGQLYCHKCESVYTEDELKKGTGKAVKQEGVEEICPECNNTGYKPDGLGDGTLCENEFHEKQEEVKEIRNIFRRFATTIWYKYSHIKEANEFEKEREKYITIAIKEICGEIEELRQPIFNRDVQLNEKLLYNQAIDKAIQLVKGK